MKTVIHLSATTLAVVLTLSGCAHRPHPAYRQPPRLPLAQQVPFIAQKPGYCGPAALAMIAQFYGHHVSQDDIAQEIYLPEIHGALTTELAAYAKQFNLWVRQYRGSWTDLRQKIRAQTPVIVLGKFGAQYHFFVVLDLDEHAGIVTVHTDTRAHHKMNRDDFERRWSRAGRWTLLACPPDRITWRLSAAEYNDLGLFHEKTGNPLKASGHYQMATLLEPGNAWYHINLGNAYLAQQLFHEAATAYARAVKIAPDNADALNNLAWAWHELDANLVEAETLCLRAIELRPTRRAYYLDTLGCILVKQGKQAEAVNVFEEALSVTTERQTNLRKMIRQHLEAARRATPSSLTDPKTPATDR